MLTSNIVHQLRSTLDNLVRELVLLHGVAAPTRHNAFPIRRVNNSPAQKRLKIRLAGLNTKHVEIITACQPWNWEDPAAHPLERLEELWNTDKHDLLQLVDSLPAPLEIGGAPVDARGLFYEDGTPLVPLMRRAVGCADAIVHAFVPALAGGDVRLYLDESNVAVWAEAFRLRDPVATARDDMDRVMTELAAPIDRLSAADLRSALYTVRNVLASPEKYALPREFVSLERTLSERLALTNRAEI